MSQTCEKGCWHPHGDWMVESAADELHEYNGNPVFAKMIIWKDQDELIVSLNKAIKLHPKVINLSFSGPIPNKEEEKAIRLADMSGILVVAASGNEGAPAPGYPAGYNYRCLLSVSTQEGGKRVPTANKGEVYLPRQRNENGTSFSAARASGMAVAYFQKHPEASCLDAKEWIIRQFTLPINN